MEENYEEDLHQAILMSKLSYELESTTTKGDLSKKSSGGNKKSKKSTIMSLEEFNNLKSSSNSTVTDNDEPKAKGECVIRNFEYKIFI